MKAQELKTGNTKNLKPHLLSPIIAESYKEVSILFADIVGFTNLSSRLDATELLHALNSLFSRWDKLCDKHGVEKIKTIGGTIN